MEELEYYIVHRSLLPDYYENVIMARDMVENEGHSVSHACAAAGISRSTFYKYKDFVFHPSKEYGNISWTLPDSAEDSSWPGR